MPEATNNRGNFHPIILQLAKSASIACFLFILPILLLVNSEHLNTNSVKIERGVLLIAKPELLDPNFAMSVVMICTHDEEGSFGLVLNRPFPAAITRNALLPDSANNASTEFRMFRGGPVQEDFMSFLFRSDHTYPEALHIVDDLWMGANPEILKRIDEKEGLSPDRIRMFLGYSGWSYYQLDCEASAGSWFVWPAHSGIPFDYSTESMWIDCLGDIGEDFQKIGKSFLKQLFDEG